MAGADPAGELLQSIAGLDLWQQVTELAFAGYTVVTDALTPDETACLRTRANVLLAEAREVASQAPATSLDQLLDRDEAFLRLVEDDKVRTLVASVLGQDVRLSSIGLRAVFPGAARSPTGLRTMSGWRFGGPTLYAIAACCLNEWKAGRGTVEVVAGSHLAPRQGPASADVTALRASPGSVVVMNGDIWRRFGAYDGPGSLPSIGVVTVSCHGLVTPREVYPHLATRLEAEENPAATWLAPSPGADSRRML